MDENSTRDFRYPKWPKAPLAFLWSWQFFNAGVSQICAIIMIYALITVGHSDPQFTSYLVTTLPVFILNILAIGSIVYEFTFLPGSGLYKLSAKRYYFLQLMKAIHTVPVVCIVVSDVGFLKRVGRRGLGERFENLFFYGLPYWVALGYATVLRWRAVSQFGPDVKERLPKMVWKLASN